MKRPLMVAFVALSLAPAAYGQGAVVSETMPLRYLDATQVSTMVRSIQGIEQFTCNLKDNSVIVRGSRKAVDAFKAELQSGDVQAVVYRMEMRVVRCRVDARGKRDETVVMKPMILDQDKIPASCSVTQDGSGYSLLVTPRQDSAQTVSLTVEVQELGEQGEVVRSGKNMQSVKLGETTRIVGMTDATDKALRRAVQHGEVVTGHGAYTAYYVDIKPIAEAPSGVPRR